jgi:hypothetical protein
MVLGRRPDHGRAADVDLLDTGVDVAAGRHRLGERVEVADQQVERLDAELGQLGPVLVEALVGQQPRVHRRMQRLHPAAQALGEPGELLHPGDRQSERGDQVRGLTGGDDLDPVLAERGEQLGQSRLVVHADQSPADRPASFHS